MQHGEIATLQFSDGLARCTAIGNMALQITNITNATPGVVTTQSTHGFNTGDNRHTPI